MSMEINQQISFNLDKDASTPDEMCSNIVNNSAKLDCSINKSGYAFISRTNLEKLHELSDKMKFYNEDECLSYLISNCWNNMKKIKV